ncbi:hypothetical protein EON82_01555 [bacterium]|nr:MAG: hypothetical protein EON82_01555 [bacterium]
MIAVLAAMASFALWPRMLVHVMPWFAAPPVSKEWGWHWTMGKLDPSKGELATHYRPLIGAYDSGDPDVIECQTLLMKFAGFDGMLVDWYGDRDRYDYLPNHRNTQKLFDTARKTGLSFALVYEDQTVPNLISGGVFKKEDAVGEGKALFERATKAWFGSKSYERLNGKPLLMVFGPQYYKEEDWKTILPSNVAFYTLHHRKGSSAVGAYDWPLPGDNWKTRRGEIAKANADLIPVAFPRFHDFYKEAGVSAGYGKIPDDDGRTYETTLAEALSKGAPIVQIATWNDWGEGTQIEPSKEFGYRDLETTQRQRRRIDPSFRFTPADLRLPIRLYQLRKKGSDRKSLDRASDLLRRGKTAEAERLLRTG